MNRERPVAGMYKEGLLKPERFDSRGKRARELGRRCAFELEPPAAAAADPRRLAGTKAQQPSTVRTIRPTPGDTIALGSMGADSRPVRFENQRSVAFEVPRGLQAAFQRGGNTTGTRPGRCATVGGWVTEPTGRLGVDKLV